MYSSLLYLTRITNKDLLSSPGNSAQHSVITSWLPGGRMGEGRVRESGMDVDTWLCLTWRTSKDLLHSPRNSAQCDVAARMGGEFGGERIRVHILIPLLPTWNYHSIVYWLYLQHKSKRFYLKKKVFIHFFFLVKQKRILYHYKDESFNAQSPCRKWTWLSHSKLENPFSFLFKMKLKKLCQHKKRGISPWQPLAKVLTTEHFNIFNLDKKVKRE